ncbi:MAG: DUF6519 domain-containing protein [Pseudomonadota bacterium]
MKGDFSRWRAPNGLQQAYMGVVMQQGRLLTDSDWNETLSIHAFRSETALTDLVGRSGTSKEEPGFEINPGAGGFTIGAGRFYVDGLMVENAEAVSYDAQSGDDLSFDPFFAPDLGPGAEALIFLEASKTHVTAQEDALLSDPALGGPDTCTRIKAQWRVRALPINVTGDARDTLIERARCGIMPDDDAFRATTGRMRAGTAPAAELPEDADCLIPPEAGYLSQENQTYRIQIVTGGSRSAARFVWSRENGAVQALLERNADGEFVLRGAQDLEPMNFVSGGWVEVFDDHNTALGTTGQFLRLTLTEGVASFTPGVTGIDQMVNPRVRRWDTPASGPARLPLTTTAMDLENGVQVSFTSGFYQEGDFWIFEARAATGTVIWPQRRDDEPDEAVLPFGWGRHYAPLALATRAGGGIAGVEDIRPLIPNLVCLEAEDIRFDDTVCQMGAETVQEALEVLCQRSGGEGICTFVAGSRGELLSIVRALQPGQHARICLRGAQFPLDIPLEFNRLGHITLEGTGPQSIVSVADGEAAFLFRDCASVRVTDMSLNGGRTGTEPPGRRAGRLGSITAINCGDTSVERVRLRCKAGLDRAAACISTRAGNRRAQVLVRDCHLTVGQAQIGVNIIEARRAVVENNLLVPEFVSPGRVLDRMIADPVLVGRISRGLLWFDDSIPGNAGNVLVNGQEAPLSSLRPRFEALSFDLNNQARRLRGFASFGVAQNLLRAIEANRAEAVADTREMRAYIRNVLATAIRNNGRARVGQSNQRIFPFATLGLPDAGYMAQGIVIAGAEVEEALVTGNHIERANDGIRIAASGREDPNPPGWLDGRRPRNIVRQARVRENVIELQPVSALSVAHGIYLGHVDNVTAGQNRITGTQNFEQSEFRPHYGMRQFGYRGRLLVWSENHAEQISNGFAVLPSINPDTVGTWRLRDNNAFDTRNRTIVAQGVDVL